MTAAQTTAAEGFVVRVTRANGSVTFRGTRMTTQAAEREAQAWIASGRQATLVAWLDAKAEMKAWKQATKNGGYYKPELVQS